MRMTAKQGARSVTIGLACCLYASASAAFTQQIHAVYRPEPANPHNNTFIIQTPPSGYCATFAQQCKDSRMSSMRLPIRFDARREIVADHSQRQGPMFKVPSAWRTLQVTHAATREQKTVEVRIVGIGSQYVLGESAARLTGASNAIEGHQQLWSGTWANAPAPCVSGGLQSYTDHQFSFFWKTPAQSSCAKQASVSLPDLAYPYLDVAYELRTPDPLSMVTGTYSGTLSYSLGPGQDFDMGDVMVPDDSIVSFDIRLEVQHTLKVEIPPGGQRIDLVPVGGWENLLSNRRRPTGLFRDQRFHLWASGPFKMRLSCEHSYNNEDCYIVTAPFGGGSRVIVKVTTSVSLPNGFTDSAGQPVNRFALSRQGGAATFRPGASMERAPGQLHFSISAYDTSQILIPQSDPATRAFLGNITVIWDSEV